MAQTCLVCAGPSSIPTTPCASHHGARDVCDRTSQPRLGAHAISWLPDIDTSGVTQTLTDIRKATSSANHHVHTTQLLKEAAALLSKDTPSQQWQTHAIYRATITEMPTFSLHFWQDPTQPPPPQTFQMNIVNSAWVTDISVVYWKEVLVFRQVFLNQLFLVSNFTLMFSTTWRGDD